MNLGPHELLGLLRNEGIEGLLLKPMFPTENGGMVSQAEVLADIINIYRMDAKLFADVHGVDLSIQKISAEAVASYMANMVDGNPVEMIECFNGIEDLHHETFGEILPEEEFEGYKQAKQSELYSHTAQSADPQTMIESGADQPTEPSADALSLPVDGEIPLDGDSPVADILPPAAADQHQDERDHEQDDLGEAAE